MKNQGDYTDSMTAVDRNLLEPASFSLQTSNNNELEGVPIKKRRFLMPKEEQTSINNSCAGVPIKKRRFPAPSPQEHKIDLENSVGKFDAVKNPLLEMKKEIVVHPNLATQYDVIARSQLNLVENAISKCKPEPLSSTIKPKVPFVQDSMGQNREVSQHQMSSLGFSSSENKIFISRSKNVDNTVDNDDNVANANRSNWDLNTTMDAWGGSGSSSANMPCDESAKRDLVAAKVNSVGAKQDSVADSVNSVADSVNSVADLCSKNVVEDVHIKSEPTQDSKNVVEDVHIKSEPTQDINKSTPILTESLVNSSAGSFGLSSISDDVANQEPSDKEAAAIPVQEYSNLGELQDSRGNDYDEKVNLSTDMIEEGSYGSGSESDGHPTKGTAEGTGCRKEEEEFEDGEIRESLFQTKLDVQIDERGDNSADREIDNRIINQDQVEEKDYNIKEQILDKGVTFQEPLAAEVGPVVAETETTSLNETQRRLDGEELFDGGDKGTETAVGEVQNENADKDANENEEMEKEDSDSSSNGKHDIAKEDIDSGGGGGSRIIILPQDLSPSKTRYSDFEGDKVHLRRNRDVEFTDGPRRFMRDRFRDQSFRGSRTKFGCGRGRAYNRFDRSEWVSTDRKCNSDNYSGPPEYRFSRNKYPEDLESNGYSDLEGSGRGGRKILSDDFPSFRNLAPRGRGPTTREFQMVRRVGRNISPNGDKYNRNFPEDIVDPMFARYPNSNEGIDDQFPRNNRKFSFVERRGIPPCVRSKSPMRTCRRTPDGYNRRSPPPIYRMERARSPPLNFRRGSPPYIARPSNDFQRPVMPNRQRFDNPLDTQQRTNNDGEYYEQGPIHAKRFDENGEEGGNGDDRRRLSERRVGENFRFRQEGGWPGPFRFGPKADSEFIDRNNNNNLRDREFDRRIKNRPVTAPSRRIRGAEDKEGGLDWHDDGFGDALREKRRRF